MKPPSFWTSAKGKWHPLALALLPLSKLYGAIVARKIAQATSQHASIPVICVGNVTLGGVGKTPFADWLSTALTERGHEPAILLRGYGGRERGPVAVSGDHSAIDVGDEAVMLASKHPVTISKDRPEGARHIANQGAKTIIMDDGLQNPSLSKDVSLVLIDGDVGLGNGRVFPSGPLREDPRNCFSRADAVIIVGGQDGPAISDALRREYRLELPIFHAKLQTDATALPQVERLVAFAGIGRPEKFFAGLEGVGANVCAQIGFADHHPYTASDLQHLRTLAAEHKAQLITTEKDLARLPVSARKDILSVPARLMGEDLPAVLAHILQKLDKRPHDRTK